MGRESLIDMKKKAKKKEKKKRSFLAKRIARKRYERRNEIRIERMNATTLHIMTMNVVDE